MAKIRKLENGKYLVDVYDKTGKRIRKVFQREGDAKKYGNMIEKDKYDNQLYRAGIQEEKITLRKAIDEFMEEKSHLQPKTIDKYNNQFRQLEGFAYSNKITYVNEFTKMHADEFKRKLLSADPSAKTANDYLTTAKSLFKEQALRDRIIKSPFEHVKKVKVKSKTLIQRENDFYNEAEIKSFFAQEIDPMYRRALLGLFLTGCRFEELANLKWDTSIDWDRKMFFIRTTDEFTTKTETSERDIPITNLLFKELQDQKDKTSSEYIFPSLKGVKMPERTLLKQCKDIAKKAGITKNATLHKWRHTYASMTERLELSFETRQYLLGHSPSNMTAHYTKVDVSNLHEKLSELEKHLE